MGDLYRAVRRGIEASIEVRGNYDIGTIDRDTAMRHLSDIGLLTTPRKAELFLDRMDDITHPKPWWKFWAKAEVSTVLGKDHPDYKEAPPPCTACRWYRQGFSGGDWGSVCMKPDLIDSWTNRVTGKTDYASPTGCDVLRRDHGRCGKDARHFEPKPAYPLWMRILGLPA